MKLVILNECFFNEEQLNKLRQIGDIEIFDDTTTEDLAISRMHDADIAIGDCFLCPFNEKVLSSTNKLKLLAINSTGYDPVDVETASKKGIKVADVPDFSTEAVAEYTFALILATSRKVIVADKTVRNGLFEVDPGNKEHQKLMGFNLAGTTLGIIGLGNIGKRVAEIAKGFNMKVIAYNRTPKEISGITMFSLDEVLKQSDIVTLHSALSSELENLIDEEQINIMKDGAILINTARGKLVDSQALYKALRSGKLKAAGIDTFADANTDNPLLELDNVTFSPHSAFFTEESLNNIGKIILENVTQFINNSPQNIVN